MNTFKVGDRVKLSRDISRYPHFIEKKGSIGTVEYTDIDCFTVKMDLYISGCEEWDNCIEWYVEDDMPFEEDIELI